MEINFDHSKLWGYLTARFLCEMGCLIVYISVPRIKLGEQRVLKSIAYISVSCGSVVNNTLKSPAYSNGFYAASMSCVYNTSIPYGKAMRLKFQSFDLASDLECR